MNPSHAPVAPVSPKEPLTSESFVPPEGLIISKDLIASEGLVISENLVKPEDNTDNSTHIILSKRLKYIMEHRHITSRQLADLIYVSESTISGYLRGRRLPDLERMRLICIDLEVSADYLLGLKKDPCIFR